MGGSGSTIQHPFQPQRPPRRPGCVPKAKLYQWYYYLKKKREPGDTQTGGIRYRWMDLVLPRYDRSHPHQNFDLNKIRRFNLLLLDGQVLSQSEIQQLVPPRLETRLVPPHQLGNC